VTDNTIFISGGAYDDIKKALKQWIALYSIDLQHDLTFELFKNGRGNHVIKADQRLDNEKFYYLVNYLNYPEEIEYKVDIKAFTTGKDENILKNKKLLVYVSQNDKDGDNVFVTTYDNKNYKVDFGGKILETKEGKIFQLPEVTKLDNPEIIKLNKKEITRHNEETSSKNIEKRFKLILAITIALYILSLLTSFYDTQMFIKSTFFFGMGLGLWFFMDDEMLQYDKYYIYGFLISVVFLCYTVLVKKELNKTDLDLLDLGAFYPMTLLIVQWPTRKIYLALFKREPKVDKFGKFADMIYSLILIIGFTVLPFLIMDNLR